MSHVGNILLDKEILLESGTNELEILVFDVADLRFGINVAKVREVLPTMPITALAQSHPSIRGVFRLRDQVIPCVSLMEHLNIVPTRDNSESTMILTDFNQQQTAFLVDEVERIHRLSWENILAVPGLMALAQTPVTALARCDERLIVMLDFEMIIDQVTDHYFRTDTVDNPNGLPRETLRILLADDSPSVREAIGNTLRSSGYTDLRFFENGAEAWNWIEGQLQGGGGLESIGDLLISDVEMPQIDGLHLTKRIKSHPQLCDLPVLLYSSIVTPDNHKKGVAVGADAQVSKPELNKVVHLADELILAARGRSGSSNSDARASIGAAEPSAPVKTGETSALSAPTDEQPAPAPSSAAASEEAQVKRRGKAKPAAQARPSTAAPGNVDSHLWGTFRAELQGRVAELRNLQAKNQGQPLDGDHYKEVCRLLHTIKSAAMVVPVHEISRTTHLAESVLEACFADGQRYPHAGLERYASWLDRLARGDGDTSALLLAAADVEADLAGHLAAAAR